MTASHRYPAPARAIRPSKFWAPKLPAKAIDEARNEHWNLIAKFTSGTATKADVWTWMLTGFIYSQMMTLLAADGEQFTQEAVHFITEQLLTYDSVGERLQRTGRAGFSGDELMTARAAACVMDSLVELDRFGFLEQATTWAHEQMGRRLGLAV